VAQLHSGLGLDSGVQVAAGFWTCSSSWRRRRLCRRHRRARPREAGGAAIARCCCSQCHTPSLHAGRCNYLRPRVGILTLRWPHAPRIGWPLQWEAR
jgi:hypothetical protein